MRDHPPVAGTPALNRREFIQSAAAAGAALMVTVPGWAQEASSESGDELAVAIIGPGSQGRFLMTTSLKIPGIRYVAVCDVWPYHQKYARNILKKYGHDVNVYVDYREMLEKEPQLDAVIVATPDWVHAEHTNACLEAGKHVYCEKEMAHTVAAARSMVQTARQTGKLLQIGHQRRSNPRYWHALKMIEKDKILGRITHTYGQWNRGRLFELGWPKGQELDDATLQRFGYANMDQFRNWRWYRKYSGGPMADLGSHQLDVFNWFLGARPHKVMASGGLDYYTTQKGRDWYDNVIAMYEWNLANGPARGSYSVFNTTSYGGFYEQVMGDEGTLLISDDGKTGAIFREVHAKRREWEDEAEKIEKMGREAIELKIGETLKNTGKTSGEVEQMIAAAQKDSRLLHLENFFESIRGNAELTCPPEIAFETCVTVMKANEAVEAGREVTFDPKEFEV